MSTGLACPACNHPLDAPTYYDGAEIICPKCSTAVPAPTTLVPTAAIIEKPIDRPSQRALVLDDEPEPMLQKEDKVIAMMAHLLGLLVSFFVDPLFGFVGPLIILMVKGKESRFVKHHAKEALNYQITIGILSFLFNLAFMSMLVGGVVYGFVKEWNSWVMFYFIGLGIAGLLAIGLDIYNICIVIFACVKTYRGEWFRYPHRIRFVK